MRKACGTHPKQCFEEPKKLLYFWRLDEVKLHDINCRDDWIQMSDKFGQLLLRERSSEFVIPDCWSLGGFTHTPRKQV